MALFLFYGSGSSVISRLNILALIALLLVCFSSYCSSSSLASPLIDVDASTDDMDIFDINDEINYYSPSHRYIHVPQQQAISPSKNRFRNLLLKSIVTQPNYRDKMYNNKRYTSQAFHAMRG